MSSTKARSKSKLSTSNQRRVELCALHVGQQKVITEANRFNVLECGRRFGKTMLGKNLLMETALASDPSAWFAPTYKYLAEVWREVLRIAANVAKSINQQEHRLELITGGVIEFWSLDQPDAGRGRKYKRIVIDEAGVIRDLESAWNESLRPTLVDLKGDAWFLGTPKGRQFFHKLFQRGEQHEPGWASWRLPTITNPNIDPAEIEAARRDMPKAAFEQEFLGIPAEDGGNPFGMSAIAQCAVAELSTAPAICYGLDLAKSYDWSVLIGLDADGMPCLAERWQSDWGQTKRVVLDTIGDTPCLVDSTGVGDPIVEDLMREKPNVEGYKFSSTSKQQLMEGLAASVQRQEIGILEGWMRSEMESFEYEYRAGGVRYSAPEGLHDDGVCSLALADRKRRQLLGSRIEVRMLGERKEQTLTRTSDERAWTNF